MILSYADASAELQREREKISLLTSVRIHSGVASSDRGHTHFDHGLHLGGGDDGEGGKT